MSEPSNESSQANGVEVLSDDADCKPAREENKPGRLVKAFRGLFRDLSLQPNIECGKTLAEVPNKKIREIGTQVLSAFAAPENSLEHVHKRIRGAKGHLNVRPDRTPIAGVHNWTRRGDKAFGIVTSLYDKIVGTERRVGDPIADCVAVVSRPNNGILAVADGVSWGEKSRLAAWCAVYGCVTHLSEHLHQASSTKDVFSHMLNSFQTAHNYIMHEDATMSTLCACVVVEMQEKNKWGLCMVNVGDSLGFVYHKSFGVREITVGSHSIDTHRDMRFAGGALGPVDGHNPDLTNLTCSFALVNEGSIVFLCSDGICDNFDPQVGHFLIPKSHPEPIPKSKNVFYRRASNFLDSIGNKQAVLEDEASRKRSVSLREDKGEKETDFKSESTETKPKGTICEEVIPQFRLSEPQFKPEERHSGMEAKLREVIEEGDLDGTILCTAQDVCARCMNFVVRNTEDKRNLHETEGLNPSEMAKLPGKERRQREKDLRDKLDTTKGKLDHASIVAFVVGFEEDKPFALCRNGSNADDFEELPTIGSSGKRPGSSSPSNVRWRVPATLNEEDDSVVIAKDIEMHDMTNENKGSVTNYAFCSIK